MSTLSEILRNAPPPPPIDRFKYLYPPERKPEPKDISPLGLACLVVHMSTSKRWSN